MRRLEYLLTEVRRSTDNTDTNGIKDSEIIGYFNYGVKYIQNIIFKAIPKANFFLAIREYDATAPDAEYDLPDDIYSDNALSTVEARFGTTTINEGYRPIRRVWQETRSDFFGYLTYNRKLVITGTEINLAIDKIRIWYFRQLRKFDKRWATVASIVPNTSITVTGLDPDFINIDDRISVVDASGNVIRANILVTGLTGLTIDTTDALTGVTAGQFIVVGAYSSTKCELPDECEPFLLDYVRQRIYTRNNYNDAEKQAKFTASQEADLISLFANNTKEITDAPITDTEFLEI